MTNKVVLDTLAPDFELVDWKGRPVRLSEYRNRRNVLLVFNRGFV